ncbi:MAG TPA: ABC transporter ATP-binding protein [Ktedonobacterales bacterium]|nr:ABC transporter ATP-binding protein [Ktedonobacterales bacterium]
MTQETEYTEYDDGDEYADEAEEAELAPLEEAAIREKVVYPSPDQTVIVNRLSKEFSSADEIIHAVDGVSFTLEARQFAAITGPSGCGKTTLLYLLGSLEKPSAGQIIIDGVDVTSLSGREADLFRRKKIGFVFQSFHLIPNLTALENVMLPMEIAGVPRSLRAERAQYLLRRVDVQDKRHHFKPGKLSGGQQQRVAIARALANDPAVILADEPTGNLDSKNSRQLVLLLRQLAQQGRTVVMVTHDRSIARQADVRIELLDGQITAMSRLSSQSKEVGKGSGAAPTPTPLRKKRRPAPRGARGRG